MPRQDESDTIEIRVIEPSDDCNLYAYDAHRQVLRLVGMHRVTQSSPVNHAVLVDGATGENMDVPVLLVSHRPVAPHCVVEAHPVALLRVLGRDQEDTYVIAHPSLSPEEPPAEFMGETRQTLHDFVKARLDGQPNTTLTWEDAQAAAAFIHDIRRSARLAQAKAAKSGIVTAAWKPLGYRVAGARRAADIEPHTESEYAYHRLPHRFQHYVDQYLATSERVLHAVNRPMMKSAIHRDWLRRGDLLQAGILFITDQQVALVTEIIPPDQASIRYGYLVHTGAPERIVAVGVRSVAENVCLDVTWQAATGQERTTWEFPREATDELKAAADILCRWQPQPGDTRLRRAYGAEPVEIELRDPAANNPTAVVPLAERLTSALQGQLETDEPILARLLIPAWANVDSIARVLALSDRRLLLVADPEAPNPSQPEAYRLRDVSSVTLKSSILDSWVQLHMIQNGEARFRKIGVPSTAPGFEALFTALRQQLVVAPVGV